MFLEVNKLKKSYGDSHILRGLSFSLEKSEDLAIELSITFTIEQVFTLFFLHKSSAAKVSATTLLILGKKDFLTPPFRAKDLINSFKDPLVREIKNSGHTLMVEEPNKVLDYLIEVLWKIWL